MFIVMKRKLYSIPNENYVQSYIKDNNTIKLKLQHKII